MSDYSQSIRKSLNLNQTQLVAGACCNWFKFEEEVERVSKSCPEDDSKYLVSYVKKFSTDLVDLICSQIGSLESESCKNLVLPEEKAQTEKTLSFIPPLLILLEKL